MILKKTCALLGVSALAFGLASCSSGDSGKEGNDYVSAWGTEPQNPLVPQNTSEVGGGSIVNTLFAGLVYYDENGAVHNEMAESITPKNGNQTFVVKIKPDMKFSDGTAVDSDSFINAWNYAVENELNSVWFFEPIQGYEPGKPLTGLKKVDDLTFEINLSQPEADFPIRLGYFAFCPLPKVAFDDMKAFGENPIGNGLYKLSDWQHNASLTVVPNETYTGTREVKNDGVRFVFYPSVESAYTDLLAGNLDVINSVPTGALSTYKEELKGRAVDQPSSSFYSFTIPEKASHFSGEEGRLRRAAISHAINRKELIDALFNGSREPAKNFTSPVVDGFDPNIPGNDVLKFDPEKAKELWAQADAISPWDGEFTLAYNADGGHQEWVDAVCHQLTNTLGIQALGEPYPDFKSFLDDVNSRKMKSAFRTGWVADYPALANYLGPLYGTGAGSNDGDYSSAEFDAALKKAAGAPTLEEGNKLYNKAQEILFKDLPAIPLYYGALAAGYSEQVSNVIFAWDGLPVYNEIEKKK